MDARWNVEDSSPERAAPSETSGWAAIAQPSAVPAEGGVSHAAMQRDGRTRSESSVDLRLVPDKTGSPVMLAAGQRSHRPRR